jgi:hypothetical protein
MVDEELDHSPGAFITLFASANSLPFRLLNLPDPLSILYNSYYCPVPLPILCTIYPVTCLIIVLYTILSPSTPPPCTTILSCPVSLTRDVASAPLPCQSPTANPFTFSFVPDLFVQLCPLLSCTVTIPLSFCYCTTTLC